MNTRLLHASALAALACTASAADKDTGVLTIEIPAAVQDTIKREKGEDLAGASGRAGASL